MTKSEEWENRNVVVTDGQLFHLEQDLRDAEEEHDWIKILAVADKLNQLQLD